jgi:hypothetical protein
VTDATADTRRDIGREWIKANVLGGIGYAAATSAGNLFIWWLDIETGYSTYTALAVVGPISAVAQSFGLVLLGYLTGAVLRRKLPMFPMRSWLVLHGLFGALLGFVVATAFSEEGSELNAQGFDNLIVLAVGVVIAGIFGALISGTLGALQALVLRNAAQGLRPWIAYSALAGITLIIMAPTLIYGPASGLAREVLEAVAVIIATAASAFIMLPALHRLVPR